MAEGRHRSPVDREGSAAVDTGPIVNMFTQLITVGTAIALIVCAFFVMLAGYQYMTAGGSVRAIESAKGSLYNAFIGLAIVVLCRVLANLVGGALGSIRSVGVGGIVARARLGYSARARRRERAPEAPVSAAPMQCVIDLESIDSGVARFGTGTRAHRVAVLDVTGADSPLSS